MNNSSIINHGGISDAIFQRFDVKPRPVIDYSVNISPLGLPAAIQRAWPQWVDSITAYPSQGGDGISTYYQKRFNLPATCILPGNGSIDLIYLIPRVLRWPLVHIPQPAFSEYERACRLAGCSILFEDPDERASATLLGSPNNPDGTALPAGDILRRADANPDRWLLVDQAFVQFTDPVELYSLLHPEAIRPNLIVLHSLTKYYALPGLRLGAAIAHPDTIRKLRNAQMPWSINRPAELAAEILASDSSYDETLNQLMRRERPRMQTALKALDSFALLAHPHANFFLLQWLDERPLDILISTLLERGFYVRDARSFPGLPEKCIRIAIRQPEENERLLEELSHV
jgi:threonine-phosphate decarboxylase